MLENVLVQRAHRGDPGEDRLPFLVTDGDDLRIRGIAREFVRIQAALFAVIAHGDLRADGRPRRRSSACWKNLPARRSSDVAR